MADLAKKLGIQAGDRVSLVDAPAGVGDLLRQQLPEGVRMDYGLPAEKCAVILFWPTGMEALVDHFEQLQSRIVATGSIWAVMPKKKYARKRGIDFSWEQMQAAGLQTDLVDNKVASIDEETYGTRFVIRKERRGKYSTASREIER